MSETRAPTAGRLALDYVEAGTDLTDQSQVTSSIPEGVTARMLYRDIVHIAWPSLIELTLAQLTSMVDLMMVGQLGPWAITSVGLSTQPKFLLQTVFMAMNVGATAMVARYKGAGEREKANTIMRQALLITFVFSLISSVLGFFFAKPLVAFMGGKDDMMALNGGATYLRIQMMGLVGFALTSTITAVLRGVGNSRTAMVYNTIANVVNVILNYILIYGHFGAPRLEVAGASLATIIGQFVAMVIALFSVLNGRFYLKLRFRDGFMPDFDAIGKIVKIGIPAMIEQLTMRAGMIIYAKTVASLGTISFATHQICMNIQALSFMTGQAFGVSATSLMGQSLGKKRPDMAQAYCTRTRRVGMCVAFILTFVFLFFGRFIVACYSDDPAVISTGARILMFVAFVQPFQSSQFILSGALRGAGDTKSIAKIIFLTVLLVRPSLALILIYLFHWGLEGAWVALVCDQLLRTMLVWRRYKSGKWKTIRV